MKIKRYMGKNTQEALLKVKMDLGNDAIILSTKKVRQKGLKKYFTSPMMEVMAAIDDDSSKMPKKELTRHDNSLANDVTPKNMLSQKEEKITQLENKVTKIETLLDRVLDIIEPENKGEDIEKSDGTGQLSQVFQLLYNNLLKNEVDQDIAHKIIEKVAEKSDARNINDASVVMLSVISSLLGKAEPINFRQDGKPTVILFVGPTGVGKTTTLAKLAASFMLTNNKNVGFITADTYRIAAVDQLKTYAEILGIPISIAYSVEEISSQIEDYSDKDVVLIDTAGCSYRDKQKFEELQKIIEVCQADEVFLVLSATVSSKNCRDIIKNYGFIQDYRLIFTKLDETPVYGSILNTKCYSNKPLAYITNGQNVPDDIEMVNTEKISKNLLGSIT
ncbi:flagellar biosynthesis protein FlhF [Ruminiclostridium cellulolyticum]|uniref:Flagellar biosynthesis protein FlhF n=1 Tax=Ruminiclostridium cellulolyticum (strain ATCC 35319 / DSM 5812 / JCM 6584 / H10) TaxID=394503 RepID=B8I3N3_RUMCH|nr:flagellar biosynthesis protein FlhF [Ruminiclostridium cellulolyticum]ACL76376.1 GTP-binding signal recognition particle SRP54 G- domain protein [Ruminiclostridium cellulolyticum H10]